MSWAERLTHTAGSAREAPRATAAGRLSRIALLHEDESYLGLLRLHLLQAGYRISALTNLEELRHAAPWVDVLLLDLTDGDLKPAWRALELLDPARQPATLPLLLCLGVAVSDPRTARLLADPRVRWATNPFDFRGLLHALAELLDERAAAQHAGLRRGRSSG